MSFVLADTGEVVDGIDIGGSFHIELASATGLIATREGEWTSICRDWGRTEAREDSAVVVLVAVAVEIPGGPM